jgi:hypothetical protein
MFGPVSKRLDGSGSYQAAGESQTTPHACVCAFILAASILIFTYYLVVVRRQLTAGFAA